MKFHSPEQKDKFIEKMINYYSKYFKTYNTINKTTVFETIEWLEKNIQISPEQFWDKLTLNLDVKKEPSIKNLNILKSQGFFYLNKSNNQKQERPWTELDVVSVAKGLDKLNLPGGLKHSFLNWAEACYKLDKENDSHKKFKLQKELMSASAKATGQVKSGNSDKR